MPIDKLTGMSSEKVGPTVIKGIATNSSKKARNIEAYSSVGVTIVARTVFNHMEAWLNTLKSLTPPTSRRRANRPEFRFFAYCLVIQ